MEYLSANGYHIIGLDELVSELHNENFLPPKSLAITFDDGYLDNYTNSYPVLKNYGFKATVFLAVDYIGKNTEAEFVSQNVGLNKNINFLSWPQIREMSGNDIFFGSHTMSHVKMFRLPKSTLENEISGSKAVIEDKLGKEIFSFSFPYAFPQGKGSDRFRAMSKKALKDSGYKLAVTTNIGRNPINSDPFFLRRIPIHVNDSIQRFSAKLQGAYDWVRIFQSIYKTI
jgi:peptidoglycan/xylan/chitin deacetylase (PgdA/CDA1 family)